MDGLLSEHEIVGIGAGFVSQSRDPRRVEANKGTNLVLEYRGRTCVAHLEMDGGHPLSGYWPFELDKQGFPASLLKEEAQLAGYGIVETYTGPKLDWSLWM